MSTLATDPVLGTIARNAAGSPEAQYSWHGRSVPVTFLHDSEAELASSMLIARSLVGQLDELVASATAIAANGLLDDANDWRDDQAQPALDAESLAQRFEFNGLSVYDNGIVEFFFDDGDVFAGHAVIVSRSADGKFESARFEG